MQKIKFSVIFIMLAAAVIAGCKRKPALNNIEISADDAKVLLNKYASNPDFMVIDIRTPGEYDAGHVDNAVNIDYYEPDFYDRIAALDKDMTYLVYCRSGNRSGKAMEIFDSLGFKHIYHMKNGYNAWK